MPECKHGLEPSWCASCKHLKNPGPSTWEVAEPTRTRRPHGFPARFESVCGGCDMLISVGEQITQLEGEWIHVRCWDEFRN